MGRNRWELGETLAEAIIATLALAGCVLVVLITWALRGIG